MEQVYAERRIKSLQKSMLNALEANALFEQLDAVAFNRLRKRVFRGTFDVFRMGVVGLPEVTQLSEQFFGWLDEAEIGSITEAVRADVMELCFRTALEAYRLGVMVSVERED